MSAVGFVAHPQRPAALRLAEEAMGRLRALGHEARQVDPGTDDADGLDLLVSLGGDGTMLRTFGAACPRDIPVLGVNFGHLGYLTVVEPDGLESALQRWLAGDYHLESRMTLEVVLSEDDGAAPLLVRYALNDVILQRSDSGHVVRVAMAVNDKPFVSYVADSVIVATPTGSTAYNLSARGPIVSPNARVQIVTPVAPHSLFDRSLVLDPTEVVRLRPAPDTVAELVVDGGSCSTVKPGQYVSCVVGRHDALFVTFTERDFQDILKRKFHLGRD